MTDDEHKMALKAAYEAFAQTPVKIDPPTFVFILNDDEQRQIAAACSAYVAALSAMPGRKLLAEALDALDRIERELSMVIGEKQRVPVPIAIAFESARAAADKIRAALTQEKQT